MFVYIAMMRECCLLVLDSVTSTPQWIRQPKPRDVVCVANVNFQADILKIQKINIDDTYTRP
jgi:hypothetical protein